jgi:hypothetical protein
VGVVTIYTSSFGKLSRVSYRHTNCITASFTGDAAVANAIVDILSTFLPIFNGFWVQSLFFILLFFGFGYINIIGLKKGVGL